MRNYILSAICFGATVFVSACTKSGEENVSSTIRNIEMTITADRTDLAPADGTRVAYDGLTALWEAGDQLHACFVTDDMKTIEGTFTTADSGERAEFTGTISVPETDVNIAKVFVWYYGDNVSGVAFSHEGNGTLAFNIPATQDGDITNHNIGAGIHAEPFTISAADQSVELPGALTFQPLFSRLDIKLDGIEGDIREIQLSITDNGSTVPFNVGTTLDMTDATATNGETVTVLRVEPTQQATEYQLALLPLDLATEPSKLDVVVLADSKYTASFAVKNIERGMRYGVTVAAASATTEEVTYLDADNFADAINNDLDGNFILTDDIALPEVPVINGFSGSFDGNGHTIDLTNAESSDPMMQGGIFNTTTGDASIKHLTVTAGERSIEMSEGGFIVGQVNDGTLTLENVHASGSITASRHDDATHLFAGGLVGFVPNGAAIIADGCSFTGNITIDQDALWTSLSVKNSYAGGIVGAVQTGYGDFPITDRYQGGTAGSASRITNCTVLSAVITNTRGGSTSGPSIGIATNKEIYTGGIAGRCTGIITGCTVTDCTIRGVEDGNGSGKQAKPIVGNDWYENTGNTDNTYTNTTVNGSERNGTYTAGPSYSDLN